jgi:hypothetical protein
MNRVAETTKDDKKVREAGELRLKKEKTTTNQR